MDATELRDELARTLMDLRSGKIKAKEAAAVASLAHAMTESAKVQVAYYLGRRQTPTVPFLDAPKTFPTAQVHRLGGDEGSAA